MLCTHSGTAGAWLLLGGCSFSVLPACRVETEALREVRAGQRALAKSQLTFDQVGEAWGRGGASRVTGLPCMAAQVVHCTRTTDLCL